MWVFLLLGRVQVICFSQMQQNLPKHIYPFAMFSSSFFDFHVLLVQHG